MREPPKFRLCLPKRGWVSAAAVALSYAIACCLKARPEDAALQPDGGVILLEESDDLPIQTSWVSAWTGHYEETHSHLGRPAYTKRGDTAKVLWFTERGYWHFGHLHDVTTGAAMIAVEDAADSPDLVDGTWKVVAGPGHWQPLPSLGCMPVYPPMLWLSGHAPSRWVAGWMGAYELSVDATDEAVDGRPLYRRRHCREPCNRWLWYTSDAEGRGVWAAGAGTSEGALLTLYAVLPHRPRGAEWHVADEDGGWRAAPSLRCTASEASTVGWYRSLAECETASARETTLRVPLACALASIVDSAAHVAACLSDRLDVPLAELQVAWALAQVWLAARHAEFAQYDPTCVAVVTCMIWVAVLTVGRLRASWLRGGDRDDDDDDAADDETNEPESSEEKRLAFACLSEAVEDVKGAITEQQYLALYSAATWCFNLTPHWAGTAPQPPATPAPAPASGEPEGARMCQLTLRVTPAHERGCSVTVSADSAEGGGEQGGEAKPEGEAQADRRQLARTWLQPRVAAVLVALPVPRCEQPSAPLAS